MPNCYDFKELKPEVTTKTVFLTFELNKDIANAASWLFSNFLV